MLQTLLSGYVVTQYREGIEHIDVIARAVPSERLELDRLPSLTIVTHNGVAVPRSQIARLHYEFEEPILWRRNRDIVLTARGDVVDNVQPPDVTNAVLPKLRSIKAALPYGCLSKWTGRRAAFVSHLGADCGALPVVEGCGLLRLFAS
jgi:multidrug efflux pump subunit AcrB